MYARARSGRNADGLSIVTRDDNDQAREWLEGENGRGEKRVAPAAVRARRGRGPGKHGLVLSHAGGLAGCENEAAEIRDGGH